MKNMILVTLLALFVGCATHPADIAPAMVESAQYEEMSCEALSVLHTQETALISDLSRSQRSSRNWDIALNVLIIPGLGALTGDVEVDLAQAKGRQVAIANEIGRRC